MPGHGLRAESQEAVEAGQRERVASLSCRALHLWRGTPPEDVPSAALHRSAEWLEELRLQLATIHIGSDLARA